MTNQQIMIEHIQKHAPAQITKEWVIWALQTTDTLCQINPKWLEASPNITGYEVAFIGQGFSSFDPEPFWHQSQRDQWNADTIAEQKAEAERDS